MFCFRARVAEVCLGYNVANGGWTLYEMEHIMDALVRLHADTMDDDQLLFARAEAIGCTVQDLLDFG